jgi:hypothetical protein
MARIYANLCEKGVRNFNTVPKNLQAQVRTIIEEDGYVINPDGTVTKVTLNEEEAEEE